MHLLSFNEMKKKIQAGHYLYTPTHKQAFNFTSFVKGDPNNKGGNNTSRRRNFLEKFLVVF